MTTNAATDNWKKGLDNFLNKVKNNNINDNKKKVKLAKANAEKVVKLANDKKTKALQKKKEAEAKKAVSTKALDKARAGLEAAKGDNKNEKAKLEQVKKDIKDNISLIRSYNSAVAMTKSFRITWKDRKSGARLSGAFYRPKPKSGYIAVGDYGQSNYGKPNGAVLTIKRNGPIKWKYPVSYTRIWKDSGSGASWDGSYWRPNPPKGYVAIGMCCQRGHGRAPSVKEIACVRKDFAERTTPKSLIWNDRKSGANRDVSVYYNEKVGTIYVQANYRKPGTNCFWTLNDKALIPALKTIPKTKSVAVRRASAKRIVATSKSVFKVKSMKIANLSTAALAKSGTVSVNKHKTTMTKMDAILAKLEKESKRK